MTGPADLIERARAEAGAVDPDDEHLHEMVALAATARPDLVGLPVLISGWSRSARSRRMG